jgi:hypothetical protein
MNRISKAIAITSAVVIGGLSIASSASAGEWRHHRHGGWGGDRGGDAVAAGIAGLAAGVIAGAIIASPGPSRVYEAPPRRYYVPDDDAYRVRYARPQYSGNIEPWTRDWYRYCENRFRTFDARSGTYVGYDGEAHFCVAN